jgi:Toluene-4-monooxygenase system protein B (TmoB)
MLVPLYGFLAGDTLGVLVLVHDTDRVRDIATQLQQASAMRVPPRDGAFVYARGVQLDPNDTVAGAGLTALDRVDVKFDKGDEQP